MAFRVLTGPIVTFFGEAPLPILKMSYLFNERQEFLKDTWVMNVWVLVCCVCVLPIKPRAANLIIVSQLPWEFPFLIFETAIIGPLHLTHLTFPSVLGSKLCSSCLLEGPEMFLFMF